MSFLLNSRLASLNGLHDRQNLLHAGNGLERLGLQLVFIADDADDRAMLALAEVRLEAQLADALQNVVDHRLGGIGFKHDDHGSACGRTSSIKKEDLLDNYKMFLLMNAKMYHQRLKHGYMNLKVEIL